MGEMEASDHSEQVVKKANEIARSIAEGQNFKNGENKNDDGLKGSSDKYQKLEPIDPDFRHLVSPSVEDWKNEHYKNN